MPWFEIYDLPLGAPLSDAKLGADGVWRRSFAAGTNVTMDTKTNNGTIAWAKRKTTAAKSDDHVGGDGCTGDGDCFGGRCEHSACVCPPSWGGPHCQVLRLQPARANSPGLALRSVETSTWGGQAIQDANGTWSLYAAQIASNCGLNAW